MYFHSNHKLFLSHISQTHTLNPINCHFEWLFFLVQRNVFLDFFFIRRNVFLNFFWFKSKLYRFRRICFNFVQYSICWHTQNNQSAEQMIYSEKKIIMKFWLCETVRLQIRTQIKSQSYDIKREKSKDCFGSIWKKRWLLMLVRQQHTGCCVFELRMHT